MFFALVLGGKTHLFPIACKALSHRFTCPGPLRIPFAYFLWNAVYYLHISHNSILKMYLVILYLLCFSEVLLKALIYFSKVYISPNSNRKFIFENTFHNMQIIWQYINQGTIMVTQFWLRKINWPLCSW